MPSLIPTSVAWMVFYDLEANKFSKMFCRPCHSSPHRPFQPRGPSNPEVNPVKHIQFPLISVVPISNLETVKGGLQGTEWKSLNYLATVNGIH